MKRAALSLAVAAWIAASAPGSAAADVFISEYVEGSSNNKAIELYNTGPGQVDLSGLELRIFFNGNTMSQAPLALAGVLPPGEAWVVANTSADPLLLSLADQGFGALSFNGNDAIVLEASGTVVDSFGQVGFDPGTAWSAGGVSTVNATLRRAPEVTAGDPISADVFDPSLEWIPFAQDNFDGLGFHDVPEPRAALTLATAAIALASLRRLRR
jgi:hypothetical protein